MTDAEKCEKVIFAIENCLTTDSVTECRKTECPFISCRESCLEWLLRSALALLKEQEAKPPIINENSYGWKFYYCPSCKKEFYQNHKFRFCEKCGQEVKWDE